MVELEGTLGTVESNFLIWEMKKQKSYHLTYLGLKIEMRRIETQIWTSNDTELLCQKY